MVKINNQLGEVKIGKQGEVVYQRKYGQQIRRTLAPKSAMPSKAQLDHRNLYRAALSWRSQLARANRRYLEGYCIANGVVDSYHIPLPWSRFALKIYLQSIKFEPDLKITTGPPTPGERKDYNVGPYNTDGQYGQKYWAVQTFTPLETYTIDKFIAYWSKFDTPNTITVGIRLTDGAGKPTGGDLTAGTTNGNTLPPIWTFEWRAVSIEHYELQQDVKYAAVARAPDAAQIMSFDWRGASGAGTYPRGQGGYSSNSGGTWTLWTSDQNFEVWSADKPGLSFKAGLLHVKHPALLTVVHKRGELIVSGYDTLSSLDDEYLTGQVGLDVEAGDYIEATTLCGIKYTYLVR